MDIIELFKTLALIPSPSLGEINVSNKIQQITYENGINAYYDDYQNLIIKIPANCENKKPLLLSAHMDVVGNNSEVKILKSQDNKYLQTDGTRTLGADDKAGVATALNLALYLAKNPDIKHGGLEIVFTRDEETNMTGINHVNFKDLDSENVLVLDSDSLGNFEIAGAGYTKLDIKVTTKLGGHSGNDIQDKRRLNAAKLIADLVHKLPNGAYKIENGFTITSCNLGSIVAGATDIGLERFIENPTKPYSENLVQLCADNVINTTAFAHYSLRSSVKRYEEKLIAKFQKQIDKFNAKYKDLAHAELNVKIHMLPFEKSDNQEMAQIAKKAGQKINLPVKVQSFHAGAETHIYANKTNKYDIKFKPVLVGVANILSMHSPNEKVEIDSLYKGFEFVKEIFLEYNAN